MENTFKVTFLCTSDVHGYYMPWDYSEDKLSKIGGLTRVSTIYKTIKKDNTYTFLIDNGDLIQGNNAENFINSSKYPGIEVINKMGYELYNMGNHEFNFGMDNLINVIGKFNGIAMMGNLYRKKNTMRFMNGVYYKIINGVKIGFISINTPLVRKFEAKRGNLKNFDVIDADFELQKLLKEVGECDALIGLFHLGDENENDIENTGVIDLLQNVDGAKKLDAIFAGHMHQLKNESIDDVIFLEPGIHAEAISRLDLYFDPDNKKKLIDIKASLIEVDDRIESDTEIEKVLLPFHNELRKHANEILGHTDIDLNVYQDIKGISNLRIKQTNLSEFFINVMLKYSEADVVAVHFDNPFPIGCDGVIKRKNINSAYSYSGGEVTNFEVTGKQLKKCMEWSASFFNRNNIGDVNISFKSSRTQFKYSTFDIFGNVKYLMDITEIDGNRIKNLRRMDDSPINDDDILILGMNKYRMDSLLSDRGPLAGEKVKQIYTTISDKSLGVRGTIRNLCAKYLSELPNNEYKKSSQIRWEIKKNTRYDDYIKDAIKLINNDSLELYTKNQKLDLNRSLNIFDVLTKSQITKLRKRYNLSKQAITLKEIIEELRSKDEV